MQYMIKLDGYLTEHGINNMIKILDELEVELTHMSQEDIKKKYDLKSDFEFYNFMVDFDSFQESYTQYGLDLQDLINKKKASHRS